MQQVRLVIADEVVRPRGAADVLDPDQRIDRAEGVDGRPGRHSHRRAGPGTIGVVLDRGVRKIDDGRAGSRLVAVIGPVAAEAAVEDVGARLADQRVVAGEPLDDLGCGGSGQGIGIPRALDRVADDDRKVGADESAGEVISPDCQRPARLRLEIDRAGDAQFIAHDGEGRARAGQFVAGDAVAGIGVRSGKDTDKAVEGAVFGNGEIGERKAGRRGHGSSENSLKNRYRIGDYYAEFLLR